MKNLLSITTILLILAIWSCQKTPVQSHTTSDSSWVVTKKDTLFIKSESVQRGINYDSIKYVLNKMLQAGLKPEIVYKNAPQSPTSLTFKLDTKGKLVADCTKGDQLIEYLTKENNRLRTSYQVKIVNETAWYDWLCRGMAVGFMLFLIIILIQSIKK